MLEFGLRNVKVALMFGAMLAASSTVARAHPGVHHDIERISKALELEPKRADLLIERGVYFRMEGNFAASLADFDRVEALDPRNIDVAVHRGMTLSAMRRDSDAERDLSRFLSSGRASAGAYAERGLVRGRLGRVDQAIDDFTKSLAINPDVEIYVERSKIQETAGKLSDAASGLREGVAATGGAVVLRDRLIDIEVRREKYDEAIRVIDDQIAVMPLRTDWLLRRAEVLASGGRREEADRDRLRALEEANRALSKRQSSTLLMARARVNSSLGRRDDARNDLESVLKLSPRLPQALALLGDLNKPTNPDSGLSTTEKRSR